MFYHSGDIGNPPSSLSLSGAHDCTIEVHNETFVHCAIECTMETMRVCLVISVMYSSCLEYSNYYMREGSGNEAMRQKLTCFILLHCRPQDQCLTRSDMWRFTCSLVSE